MDDVEALATMLVALEALMDMVLWCVLCSWWWWCRCCYTATAAAATGGGNRACKNEQLAT
jgi:hypothetical protein